MKLLAENKNDFKKMMDSTYNPETSIVLRYRNLLLFEKSEKENSEFREWLGKTSIQEGVRILPLGVYKGVDIWLLDETSFMHSRTLKSIDGCITTARCKWNGHERVVFESGGNTGTALTLYGIRAGLETFMFIPEENLPLLNSKIFESNQAHLFSVKRPNLVKQAVHLFGRMNGFKHIPEKEWRFEASMFRGLFILETMLEKQKFDWLTQTISAAFGPIGIYEVLNHFHQDLGEMPRFLGIQQESNCPMYKAWKSIPDRKTEGLDSTLPLLTKVMYDGKPQTYGTYETLRHILISTRGDLTTINHQEFNDFLEKDWEGKKILDRLKEHGIEITLKKGDVIEKTGMIALAGTLKEIDRGTIARGERVLCALTSGISEADGKAKPELNISSLNDLDEIFHKITHEI